MTEMPKNKGLLDIARLTKNFGGLRALDDVSLNVTTGNVTSLIGPNGAGKTTLFNIVTGVFPAERGIIHFNGLEISNLKGHERARLGIARTFQNLKLFKNMNVLENVMLAFFYRHKFNLTLSILNFLREFRLSKQAKRESEDLLQIIGLFERRFSNPTELPHGFQRKLEIARALALEPKLLLLDEPFSGMTPTETLDLMNLVSRLKSNGITIFLIEHNMNVVMEISDWIVVLNFGKQLSEGTAEDVKKSAAVKEAYLGS